MKEERINLKLMSKNRICCQNKYFVGLYMLLITILCDKLCVCLSSVQIQSYCSNLLMDRTPMDP